MAEALFAIRANVEGDSKATFQHLRSLTSDEIAASEQDEALLRGLTSNSELAALRAAADEFHAALDTVEEAAAHPMRAQPASAAVQRTFKAWLSAFRSFDDRTCAWLSRWTDDAAVREFRRLLSLEYDANFAYRLSAALRNVSEHAGHVINAFTLSRGEGPDGPRTTAVVGFDGPRLVAEFTSMKASVRNELEACSALISVEGVVGAAMLSCESAHAGLLLHLASRLAAAVGRVRTLQTEADPDGNDSCIAAFVDLSQLQKNGGGKMQLRYNPIDLARVVEAGLSQSPLIRAAAPLRCLVSDLEAIPD